jgi:ribosomal protein L11 methyltransferase
LVDPTRRWHALDIVLRAAETHASDAELAEQEGLLLAFLDDYGPTAITAPPGGEDGWLVTASADVTPAWLVAQDGDDDPQTPPAPRAWRVFFPSPEARTIARTALAASDWGTRIDLADVDVPDEGWAERSQAALKAVQVGHLIIAPPWDFPTAAADVSVVVIEPSMGFGTGHHESTRLCLQALQAIELAGRRVLDIGTGSGVLAIAAGVLGAESVLGLDDDRDAVEAAWENVRLNHVEARVRMQQADLARMEPQAADVVLANLTGAILRRYASVITSCLTERGLLIVSGFTRDEQLAVTHEISQARPLELLREDREDGWISLTFKV